MRIVAINEQTIRLSAASRNCEHQLRRHDGERARGAYRRAEGRQAADRARLRFDRPLRPRRAAARALHSAAARRRPATTIPTAMAASIRHKAWAVAMRNEKPGGHGERPGAVGLHRRGLLRSCGEKGRPAVMGLSGAAATARGRAERDRCLCERRPLSRRRRHRAAVRRRSARRSHADIGASRSRSAACRLTDDLQRIEAVLTTARTRHDARRRRQRHLLA